jgi:nucleoside-diphosphate-sugar epimerase
MYTGPQILGFLNAGRMVLFGDGGNIHSFAHAEDVARCLILAAENPSKSTGEAFNVISFACSFKEFVDAIVIELGVSINYRRIRYGVALGIGRLLSGIYNGLRRPNSPLLTPFRVKLFGSSYLIDISKAREDLGYEPKWDLKSTAKDIVDWGGEVKPR